MAEKSAEEVIIAGRKDKAARLRTSGQNPFANDSNPENIAHVRMLYEYARATGDRYDPEVLAKYDQELYTIAGRILFMRHIGGATFIRLRDRTGELQVYCEEKILGELYSKLNDFDLGDIIEASGSMMATVKGELSVQANGLRLLTKSYRPLPVKTALKDVELRYRQRYVDLISNQDVMRVFRARANIVMAIRNFMNENQFIEAETPTMQSIPGGASAKPFKTHHNALDMELYMRVAPELYLKRLVVGGFERVYEIGRNYRNEGVSTRHNPEFTMIEYYQSYATAKTIINQTQDMLQQIDNSLQSQMPEQHAVWLSKRTFSLESFAQTTMLEAVQMACANAGVPINVHELLHLPSCLEAVQDMPAPIKQWSASAKACGRVIDWSGWMKAAQKAESDGERLYAAFEYAAEPFLTQDYRTTDSSKSVPVFITEYPIEVSPLARRLDNDPNFVDRFELFVDGKELCNAFSELNDPEDQATRFQAQMNKKAGGDEEAMEYDEDYIRALEYGMPPTAGFGMGIDRLVMMLTNSASIRDVILFPLLRPE